MEFIRVIDWENLQHYKDRDPKWIKVYRGMLSNYNFNKLPDAAKGHLILIWLLAAQLNNQIPNDPAWIKEQIHSQESPDIECLVTAGFLECYEAADKPVQLRTESYAEKSRVEKRRTNREYDEKFEMFWKRFRGRWDGEEYVKDGKYNAWQVWQKLTEKEQRLAWAASSKTGKKFTVNASRWLEEKRFDDYGITLKPEE